MMPVYADAIVAYAHFVGIIVLGFTLLAEWVLFRRELTLASAALLRKVDAWYGLSAAIVLGSGLLRLFAVGKGSDFYLSNPIFWTKMALFIVVALLSIYPTIVFAKWKGAVQAGQVPAMSDGQFGRVRGMIRAECLLLAFIPLMATLMARGVGMG